MTLEGVIVFVDNDQIDEAVRSHLASDVQLQPYASFFPYLKGLASELNLKKDAV